MTDRQTPPVKKPDPIDIARRWYGKTLGVSGDLERYKRAADLFAQSNDADQRFVMAHLQYLQLQEATLLRREIRRLVTLLGEVGEDVSTITDQFVERAPDDASPEAPPAAAEPIAGDGPPEAS